MKSNFSYGEDYKYIPGTSLESGVGTEVLPDLYCHTIQIVNICLVGVEGGMVSKMSGMFPIDPINLGNYIQPLPEDGSVPHLPKFRWIHTPGHSSGNVSFFREDDKALIAGDAFVTVKQEYLYKVFTQEQEISGPPRYLTTDWEAAFESVKKLNALKPSVAITGHGIPMAGELLTDSLHRLEEEFDQIAVPDFGKYVDK